MTYEAAQKILGELANKHHEDAVALLEIQAMLRRLAYTSGKLLAHVVELAVDDYHDLMGVVQETSDPDLACELRICQNMLERLEVHLKQRKESDGGNTQIAHRGGDERAGYPSA